MADTNQDESVFTDKEYEDAVEYAYKMLCKKKGGVYSYDKKTGVPTCSYTKAGCKSTSGWPYNSTGTKINDKQYLEWIPDSKAPAGGRCMAGNELFKYWCEYPTKRLDEHGNCMIHKTMCDKRAKFTYDEAKGTCQVTSDYCRLKGVEYDRKTGECYIPRGQELSELILSTTLVRDIKTGGNIGESLVGAGKGAISGIVGAGEFIKDGVGNLFSDHRLKTGIHLVSRDYAGPGINLYTFYWNELAHQLYDMPANVQQVGVIAQEVEAVYPDFINKDIKGYKYIVLDYDKSVTNPFYNKIYQTAVSNY